MMTEDARKVVAAQRILNDPALLKMLANKVKEHPAYLDVVLAEINDSAVRDQIRAAITAENQP